MTPEQIQAEAAKHPPIPKPSNLKVLPPDIAVPDLVVTMVRISEGLAVQCPFCHEVKGNDIDFASDSNPNKNKARMMLRMTDDTNRRYLAELPGPRAGGAVTCATCHQGHEVPPEYHPPAGFVLR